MRDLRTEAAVLLENLADGAVRIGREQEKRLGHISELAHLLVTFLAAQGEDTSPRSLLSAAASALSALGSDTLPVPPCPPHHRAMWESVQAHLSDTDRAHLARAFLAECEAHLGRSLGLSDFAGGTVPPPERGRIVCVRNPHTEEVLARFLPLLTSPTVSYRDNFRELFDDVESGYADYAVLPLLSGGVPLGSVSAMLEEYDLHAVALAPHTTGENEAVFALLSRESVRLATPTAFLFTSALTGIGERGLFSALELLSLSLDRLDVIPATGGDGRLCRLAVRGSERALIHLLVYLSLFIPGYIGHGFYIELD